MPEAAFATNKTHFMRYMNDHPQTVPALKRLAADYAKNPHGKHTFGFWLRVKYPTVFDNAYHRFWMKHPELHGKVYCEAEEMAG